jgi:hypothetical protein
MSSPNGLTPSTANESLRLRGSTLKCGHISSIFLNADPSAGIQRTPSLLLFFAW